MYDGTIVILYAKPGLNGDAYFTRKSNYGLNLQVVIIITINKHILIELLDWKFTFKSSCGGLFPWVNRICP